MRPWWNVSGRTRPGRRSSRRARCGRTRRDRRGTDDAVGGLLPQRLHHRADGILGCRVNGHVRDDLQAGRRDTAQVDVDHRRPAAGWLDLAAEITSDTPTNDESEPGEEEYTRKAHILLSAMWIVGLLLEVALRLVVISAVSVDVANGVMSAISLGTIGLLIAATILIGRRLGARWEQRTASQG